MSLRRGTLLILGASLAAAFVGLYLSPSGVTLWCLICTTLAFYAVLGSGASRRRPRSNCVVDMPRRRYTGDPGTYCDKGVCALGLNHEGKCAY